MTKEQILAAVLRYKNILQTHPILDFQRGNTSSGVDTSKTRPSTIEQLSHVQWMCEEIPKILETKPQKAERWICFVQGVLWTNGLGSIDSFKDDNR